jgi:hypothetical protein
MNNIAAQTIGAPADLVALAAVGLAATPGLGDWMKAELGVESAWDVYDKVPGNSDRLMRMFGGDPEHPSALPAGFLTPGPAELRILGKWGDVSSKFGSGEVGTARAARRGSIEARQRLEKLSKLKELDAKTPGGIPIYDKKHWKETGWYKKADGNFEFWIDDSASKLNADRIVQVAENLNIPVGESERIPFLLGDILEHDELYKIYPELAKMRVNVWMTKNVHGDLVVPDASTTGPVGQTQVWSFEDTPQVMNLEVKKHAPYQGMWESVKRTLHHEAAHTVAYLEQWSSGAAGSSISKELINEYKTLAKHGEAARLIHSGVHDKTELATRMIDDGFTPKEVSDALNDPNIREILKALDDDDVSAQLIGTHYLAGMIDNEERVAREMVNFLEFARKKGEDPFELIDQMNLNPAELERLRNTAYWGNLGEINARLHEAFHDRNILNPRVLDPELEEQYLGRVVSDEIDPVITEGFISTNPGVIQTANSADNLNPQFATDSRTGVRD